MSESESLFAEQSDRSDSRSGIDPSSSRSDPAAVVGRTRRGGRGIERAEVRIAVARELERAGEDGLAKSEIVTRIGNDRTSLPTVQRALDDLRELGAPIAPPEKGRGWRLTGPFSMPLEAPDRDDLLAVLIARAILEPVADATLRRRIDRLVEDIDARVRDRTQAVARDELPHRVAFSAALTLGTRVDASTLRLLSTACPGRKVVRIKYESPWKPVADAIRVYEIEPWALRVHDGTVYLRAWSRDAEAPRTFRVAQILEASPTRLTPRGRTELRGRAWGDEHPAFGIDQDRPGMAVVRLRGTVARWVERIVWHPDQRDVWKEPRELLERTVAYRSCREMARRLVSVIDGVEAIEPTELRAEVVTLLRVGLKTLDRARGGELDDLPGIMQRVRPGADEREVSGSEAVPSSGENTNTARTRRRGGGDDRAK